MITLDAKEYFSELLVNVLDISPMQGELQGQCCICKKHTNHGFKKKFGANFTASEFVSNGDVICPECQYIVENSNEYRRTMFLLTQDKLIKFKKAEAKEIIFNLPDEPFYIYLTKTWQKIGWIRMNDAYNHDNKNRIKFVLDYDIISTELDTLKNYADFIKQLRDLKISKKTLEHGSIEIYEYKKIMEAFGKKESSNILKIIQDNINNPIWELALYLEK